MPLLPGTIDLHTHSTVSDGALTPTQLVAAAAAEGVITLALTDHDTLAGIAEARAAALEHDVRLIPGVEISVTWQRRTLHIVGLAVDCDNSALNAGLRQLQHTRHERARRMATKLEKLGMHDVLARVMALANGGQITRPHFARLMLEDGLCKNMQQCFKRYLKAGKPAHVSTEWATLEDAIGWIHAASGIAVLAHPHAYKMTAAWRRRMYAAFAAAGGDAAEVCCGTSTPDRVQTHAAQAATHGLMGSVGSDFHSHEQRWLKLGRVPTMPKGLAAVWEHPAFGTPV